MFGMGTGGTSSPLSPETVCKACVVLRLLSLPLHNPYLQNLILNSTSSQSFCQAVLFGFRLFLPPALAHSFARLLLSLRASDQALDLLVLASSSIAALTPPTYQPCRLQGVLPACAVGYFFLRWASRLDAFSVYPIRTSLLCYAFGKTTVAPEVRPFRSSRTRNSSSHVSFAHDG